ncbi:MAG: SgcJ/EcaC family oxidoreductase [Solirubrobacterales bacterium]|nr:SgcJ/EcaC family oxidoreductase [Solirubrobacterales bacterium]
MPTFAEPREIVDAFAAALNAKDADAVGEIFSGDAEFVNIAGMRMGGRDAIVAGHAWAFSGPLRGSRVSFDQVDELPVTEDVAVLHGHCLRERLPDAPENTLPPGTSVLVFVARRGSDGWRAVAATNVTEAPLPSS